MITMITCIVIVSIVRLRVKISVDNNVDNIP